MMKEILSLLLVTLFFSGNIFAQIGFGVKAGLNYSNVNFNYVGTSSAINNSSDQSYLLGLHAGFILNKDFDNRFSLEANILYSQEGFKFINRLFGYSGKVVMHYIHLPISLGYEILPKTTISLGPNISYLLASKEKTEAFNGDASGSFSKKFSVGGVVGINYAFTDHLEIGIRYVHGITQLNEDTDFTLTDEQGASLGTVELKTQGRVFQLSMRYKI